MRPTTQAVLLALSLLITMKSGFAADWPQFRGTGGQGVAGGEAYPTKWTPDTGVAWKSPLPGPGSSSPAIYRDRIYLTCYTGYTDRGDIAGLKRHLLCMNRADGKTVWTADLPVKQPEQERIREGHGYATSTPAVDADGVYVYAGKSGLFAFDHTGKQRWTANCGERVNGWGSAASPILHGKLVIINASVESESLQAFDRATGKPTWRADGIKEAWNTPILAPNSNGKTELVVPIFQKVLGVDPDTGKQLWECKTDINWYMAPSAVADKGIVYCIGGRTGGALAIRLGGSGDVTSSHRIWTGTKGSNVSSPILHSGHLFWMNDTSGTAYCADAMTGKIVYEERVGRGDQVYASPILAGGNLYYISRMGKAHVIAAKPQYELLATNEVESRGMFNASPAAADGRIYLRSDRFLYCIGK